MSLIFINEWQYRTEELAGDRGAKATLIAFKFVQLAIVPIFATRDEEPDFFKCSLR